jgi:hypothetical protein
LSVSASQQADLLAKIRTELVPRLRRRSGEIAETIFARIYPLAGPAGGEDAEYVEGLRAAVRAGVDHELTIFERADEAPGAIPFPPALDAQSRRAARAGVTLDTILRRYAAGDRMLAEFVLEEAGDEFSSQALRQLMRSQAPHVDRLMAAMASAYMEEMDRIRFSPAQRLAKAVEQLLSGAGPSDFSELDYEFEAWHTAVIASGRRAAKAVQVIAKRLDRAVLVVPRGEGAVWAWLGGREALQFEEVRRGVAGAATEDVCFAVGESRDGIGGWRLTHDEAQAAHQVMLRRTSRLIRGSEVLLLAAVLREEAIARCVTETFLAPLDREAQGGAVMRETLRAYFRAGRNTAAAAAALGVDRHTIQRRLRKAEEALGRLLHDCQAEIEVGLALEELDEAVRSTTQ